MTAKTPLDRKKKISLEKEETKQRNMTYHKMEIFKHQSGKITKVKKSREKWQDLT